MSDDFNCDISKEDEMTPCDHGEIMFDDDGHDYGIIKYMPPLLPNEELSPETLQRTTLQFSEAFAQRYPSSSVHFHIGSLDNALNESVLSLTNPRPLILYIRHDESPGDNIFCEKFFHSKKIVDLLNSEFVIWPWDQTDINYYQLFLQLLIEKLGSKVASEIHSYTYSETPYPWLVCLAKEQDQYTVLRLIDNRVVEEEMMMTLLSVTRDDFDQSNNPRDGPDDRQVGNWHIPRSLLTAISRQSDQFQAIARNLTIVERKITSVQSIENLIWSAQYALEKRRMDGRIGQSPIERTLLYGCPSSMADKILRSGFALDTNCIHGDEHGRGFYFSSQRHLCEKYHTSDDTKNDPKAILICRILTADSTSTADVFVLSRNEQILPNISSFTTTELIFLLMIE